MEAGFSYQNHIKSCEFLRIRSFFSVKSHFGCAILYVQGDGKQVPAEMRATAVHKALPTCMPPAACPAERRPQAAIETERRSRSNIRTFERSNARHRWGSTPHGPVKSSFRGFESRRMRSNSHMPVDRIRSQDQPTHVSAANHDRRALRGSRVNQLPPESPFASRPCPRRDTAMCGEQTNIRPLAIASLNSAAVGM